MRLVETPEDNLLRGRDTCVYVAWSRLWPELIPWTPVGCWQGRETVPLGSSVQGGLRVLSFSWEFPAGRIWSNLCLESVRLVV